MVFVSPVFFDFDLVGGAVVRGKPCEAVLGSAPAAGPLLLPGFDNLLFCFFLLLLFFRDEAESELVAAAVPHVAVSDGAAPPPPPPLPPEPEFTDEEAAAVELEEAAADKDGEDVARSSAHSSLCPARHAALWQAWLQYFRCRQPEQKCSAWSFEARARQNAHSAMIAGLEKMVTRGDLGVESVKSFCDVGGQTNSVHRVRAPTSGH